jgi:hypothetical protein
MHRPARIALSIAALMASGCDGSSEPDRPRGPSPDAATAAGTDEVPPQGQAAIEAWLRAEHYLGWACESDVSPPRLNGAHGLHRICTNRALLDSTAIPYPVGAASVKELYDRMNRPAGYAVGLKVAAGEGPETWYWYERTGSSPTARPVADGVGVKICGPDCHQKAPNDNVFLRAR